MASSRRNYGRVALCYIRQSWTRDEKDITSPERQRANIERVCEQNGWIPEWYEDVGGHRSGTSENNRPQWLSLKSRIGDKDVVAVVANDLSRLHRNLLNISQLIESLERNNLRLVLAATNNELDVTTLTGQMFAQMRGLMDAFYAKDISAKAKDSVNHRKRQGKTIGMPPFGTEHDQDGYLIPSPFGAWLLPDGTFEAGMIGDDQPHEDAVWRSYYDCTYKIFKLYIGKRLGMHRIAYALSEEGWAFRDRKKRPRPITEDDVRRVLANVLEYGGIVSENKIKNRPGYTIDDPDKLPFDEERAVYPIPLLREVARQRKKRTVRPKNHGINRDTHPYPLGGLIYCAHCDQLAEKHENPKLRSRLGGSNSYGKRRYRHKGGTKCGATNRSVHCVELDEDFGRLVKLLTVRPEALDLMIELGIQVDKEMGIEDVDIEKEKRAAIALCKRRIDAAINLYRDGVISRDDYLADVEKNEREIAHWEARTSETQQHARELALCMQTVGDLSRMWDISEDEERQALAQGLFTEIVYDLDTRRIVDFKLKPWADRFLTLRACLYGYEASLEIEEDDSDGDDDNTPKSTLINNEGGTLTDNLKEMWQDPFRSPVWSINCLTPLVHGANLFLACVVRRLSS
jgi:DNA invertase Pin-like site-specific DNA recombinase